MDPISNPFSPGAGAPPPELVGRDDILTQMEILLARVKQGRPEKSMLLTGLRGVGKTVLLNEAEHIASNLNYKTIFIEAHDDKSLAAAIAMPLKRVLFSLNRLSNAGDKVKRALSILKSFASTIKLKTGNFEIGLDIEPEPGSADSGDIEEDLPNLLLATAEAAKTKQAGIALIIDEVQYFPAKELSALIMALHKIQQKSLPLVFIGAGLPILPGLIGDSKSYAERLLQFPIVGALSRTEADKVIQDPAQEANVTFTGPALAEIFNLTQGYPYFLQEWGYQAWNIADQSPIDINVIKDTTKRVIERLDENFFRVRFDRLSTKEKEYLRAMAELGEGAIRSAEVTSVLGTKSSAIAATRDRLIKKGMIYAPQHGYTQFTVPLFSEFMRRMLPNI